jgi:DNA-directed RNA polymerase subunit RPC12/RpoP
MNPNQLPTEKLNAQVDIKNTSPIKCEKCGGESFFYQQTVMLRSVSAIVSPSGKTGILPIPVPFSCAACGHINKEFIPSQLKNEILLPH